MKSLPAKIILCVCCIACCGLSQAQHTARPVRVIFDSDMGPDYDDVGAITMLHAFADQGKAKILATMASTKYANVGAVLNVFNTYFKRPSLPVGVPHGRALELKDWQHWSDTLVVKYPHRVKGNDELPDAVSLYRKILASQPDHGVTIITVGFLTNIANLLKSGPDSFSRLSGMQLVMQKVKQLVSMAGRFPSGKEFNIDRDFLSSKYAFEHAPVPVLFSGFEIGEKIKCGLPLIHSNAIHNSPVKDVFRISIPMAAEDSAGRKSWDETAVLVAVLGYEPFYTIQRGQIAISDKDGSNTWTDDDKGPQARLVEKADPQRVRDLINRLMMHRPGHFGKP